MPELKPCPFCGGKATIDDNGGEYPIIDEFGRPFDSQFTEPSQFWVTCENCRTISGVSESEAEAVAIWNRRVTNENA